MRFSRSQPIFIKYKLTMGIKTKVRKLNISMSEKTYEMLQVLFELRGHTTISGAIADAIYSTYRKDYPAYTSKAISPLEAEKQKRVDLKTQAQIDVKNRCMITAEALGAQIVVIDGVECARYYTYHMKDRFENTVPLLSLTESLIVSQYFPSREKVEALQKSGECHYDVSNVI